jgi:hypothetical protein
LLAMEGIVRITAEIARRLWDFAGQQVGRPYGWVLPLALAPVVFGFLSAFEVSDIAVVLGTCLAALVIPLFWRLYAGLWRGNVPWMRGHGAILRALLWSAALWLLAISVLAPISSLFYEAQWVEVRSGIENHANSLQNASDFAVLYLWQTADAIPALGVVDTLSLGQPVMYDDWKLGLMLLVYKAAVLIPVIAAFRGVWASRRA